MTVLAGYRELEKRDFQASRLAVFGLLKHHRILLARRPVQRLFFIGRGDQHYIDFHIATGAETYERGAVIATVRYYTIFGREIGVDAREQQQVFFADPVKKVERQRFWLVRPKNACFALVTVQRAVKGRQIGLAARFKLLPRGPQSLSDAEILQSRDRKEMEDALAAARFTQDRTIAERLLKRLVFLWQDERHARDHFLLSEANRLMLELYMKLVKRPETASPALKPYRYEGALSRPYDTQVSVRKWCGYEAALLKEELQKTGADSIHMPAKASVWQIFPAFEACCQAGIPLLNEKTIDTPVNWISEAEIRRLLAALG